MLVFLNGRFVPEDRAMVPVFDRSFLYGDGLFESVLICNGRPFRWAQHLARLEAGAGFLGIQVPYSAEELTRLVTELLERNGKRDVLLRLTLSRGVGIRGYSPKGATHPALVMSLHETPGLWEPGRWKVATSSIRLPAGDPVGRFKTCNKLPQILARAEAEAVGADEALLLSTDGFVVEGASSNLFWVREGRVGTSPLDAGILSGITRAVVQELCRSLGVPCREENLTLEQLKRSDGVFVSLSTRGVVPVESVDGAAVAQSPVVERIREAYVGLVRAESGISAK